MHPSPALVACHLIPAALALCAACDGSRSDGGTRASAGFDASTAGVGTAGSVGATPGGAAAPGIGGVASVSGGAASVSGGAASGGASGGVSSGARGGAPASGGGDSGGAASQGTVPTGGRNDAGSGPTVRPAEALGAYSVPASPVTRGGTMTFTNVGAPGWWPRRLDRPEGDPACDIKDGTDTWGGRCCLGRYDTTSDRVSPFDEEMTLIVKAFCVRQLAVYQPEDGGELWSRVSAYDDRRAEPDNLWFTQRGDGAAMFPGDLTHDDCVGYLSQEPRIECSELDYTCPEDPGVLHRGWSGSKLFVMLGSMTFDDAGVAACDGDGAGHPGPWVALVASELIRDGGRKWNGLCNCYSRTGSVGDGCGEINLFEVVLDDNDDSNREFMSTGLRSFQAGHVGGNVCGAGCTREAFAADVDVLDACGQTAYEAGPGLEVGGTVDGCPVWLRPVGDRYFLVLLDETTRVIQVAVLHPEFLPAPTRALLPELPNSLPRSVVDGLVSLRLPG